ncbi:MarR family transcriptional regulator [candidate division KSB1 bacterium]|nr:MarR family transcriptional regulator [candidate division KSB1 bacterium]
MFRLLTNCTEKEVRHVAKYGVTVAEFRCLKALLVNESVNMNQLAQEMQITNSRMTRIIDNLVDKKLVQRIENEQDRRMNIVTLTPDGQLKAQMMLQSAIAINSEILGRIPNEKHESVIDAIDLLGKAIESWLHQNDLEEN